MIRLGKDYFLYYTICYQTDPFRIGIGIAQSCNMEDWQDWGEFPLTQECEQNGVGAPAAIVLNGQIHLFYQTYGNGKRDAICHAISKDGVHFEKDPSNPVFRPSSDWCCGRAIDADVCVFGDKLFMYFATRDHEMKIQKVGSAWAPLHSDFSRDAWTQAAPQSVLAPELPWEGECIEAPATVVNNGKVFMFYGGSYNCTPQQIGCAVSEDGVFFRKIFVEPFMQKGDPGSWNQCESGHPYVFRDDDDRVYLFYQGSADMGKTWYISRVEIAFDPDNTPNIVG